jgi:hypothetical protein
MCGMIRIEEGLRPTSLADRRSKFHEFPHDADRRVSYGTVSVWYNLRGDL